MHDEAATGGGQTLDMSVARVRASPTVGIAGVGGVASFAHVPAYRQLGFPVALIYDTDPSALDICRRALGTDGAETVSVTDEQEFLDLAPSLDMLDIAIPSHLHGDFLRLLFDKLGRRCPALLVQKPLADASTAAQLVDRAEALGVRMAVNLTARWVPPFAKLRELALAGVAGDGVAVSITNRGFNPKDGKGWRSQLTQLIILEMSIHHIDLIVWIYGLPLTVYAVLQHVPDQGVFGENVAHILMVYDNGLKVSITEDWTCRDPIAARYHPAGEEIVVSGSRATLVATPHQLRVTTAEGTERYSSPHDWFPEAFAGPASEFAAALHEGRDTPLSARQHVDVLRVIEACYRSAESNRVIDVSR